MPADRVEIDPAGLSASVAHTTAAAAGTALKAGQGGLAAATHADGDGEALSAAIAAIIATWPPQTEAIAADLAAGGIHLGQRTTETTAGLTEADHDGGSTIDAITI